MTAAVPPNPSTNIDILAECSSSTTNLNLCKRELQDDDIPSDLSLPQTLLAVDLSRNFFRHGLPHQIFHLPHLTTLDISRNNLRSLPPEIKHLTNLVELHALANHFRIRMLPLVELASLPSLRLLDLRYNPKLKEAARTTLIEALTAKNAMTRDKNVEVRCTIPDNATNSMEKKKKPTLSACDRDATLLRSQLEPLSTPQLRKRLEHTFGVEFPQPDNSASMILHDNEKEEEEEKKTAPQFDREYVMQRLLQCYATTPNSRTIHHTQGIPIRPQLIKDLTSEIEAVDWPITQRERPKIRAQYYMILQRPGSGVPNSARTKRETAKLEKYQSLFDKAVQAIDEVDSEYAHRFTALAVTKNFVGSPHIDTLNTCPFYGLSLGEFTPHDGGRIAVECSPMVVAEVDTRGRLAKVDGRFPHWVTPYDAPSDNLDDANDGGGGRDRYSLIYYATSGEVIPQTTAIFEPTTTA